MKIIERSKMLDGTTIQIEDWREDYSHVKTLEIGAYPKAKNTSENELIELNKTFRLELTNFENDEQVKNIFKQLEEETINLSDLNKHFRNGKKDEFYLGLSNSK